MKLTLTRAMAEELMSSEVDTFMSDWGATAPGELDGWGHPETPGRRDFVAAVIATFDRMGGYAGRSNSGTLTLTGEALAYAANDAYGPFATRADILSDWGPEYGSLARAMQARQRAAAEEIVRLGSDEHGRSRVWIVAREGNPSIYLAHIPGQVTRRMVVIAGSAQEAERIVSQANGLTRDEARLVDIGRLGSYEPGMTGAYLTPASIIGTWTVEDR